MDRDRNGAGVPAILWSRMRHQILKRQNCHWRKPSTLAFVTTKQHRTATLHSLRFITATFERASRDAAGLLISQVWSSTSGHPQPTPPFPCQVGSNEAGKLVGGRKCDSKVEHGIIIVNHGPCFLAFSLGQPYAAIINGNLGGNYLHSERRATCFNCMLVTSFLRAYRSERLLDEFGF